jgi:hypothetical protein
MGKLAGILMEVMILMAVLAIPEVLAVLPVAVDR